MPSLMSRPARDQMDRINLQADAHGITRSDRFDRTAPTARLTWRNHVDHLCRTGVSDRPCTPHDQDRAGVDVRLGLDTMVVILGPVEHGNWSLERHRVVGVGEVLFPEGGGDDRGLHDGAVKEGALEVEEARLGHERLVEGEDDAGVLGKVAAAVVADGLARDGERVRVGELVMLEQLGSDG